MGDDIEKALRTLPPYDGPIYRVMQLDGVKTGEDVLRNYRGLIPEGDQMLVQSDSLASFATHYDNA